MSKPVLSPDLLIENIGELATLASSSPPGPRQGMAMKEIGMVPDGAVAVANGKILATGPRKTVLNAFPTNPDTRVVDAKGGLVTPGLIDAHTHLVFAGNRENEFRLKIEKGLTYTDIEKQGGGVPASVRHTRAATRDELLEKASAVLGRMLRQGVTTIEAKSGYALDTKGEIRLLEVMAQLDETGPVQIVPTLFGAHDMPPEFAGRPDDFLALIMDEMIPEVAKRKLARFYDSGVTFDVEKTASLFERAKAYGMQPKVHADEFAHMGGAALSARCGAVSAEHCLHASDSDLAAMKAANVIAVLLPAVPIVHLLDGFVNARRFVDAGLAVALGTDFNPSCPVESMAMVLSLSCYGGRLCPAEALTAATLNAAWAIGLGNCTGALEPGKQADLVIWQVKNHVALAANPGGNLADQVFKKGESVWTYK